ncbi:MAG TPA: hypothetical protein VMX17_16820 [Candidatus Glassbacteria bacterium]|nr:hypothetical protein [Candidatus Glassbacteria bacterium]
MKTLKQNMKKLIEKYIKRILIDYPEEDKLYIDLMQFAHEINFKAPDKIPSVIDNEQKKKKCYMPNMCLHRGSVKVCMNCSSYRY